MNMSSRWLSTFKYFKLHVPFPRSYCPNNLNPPLYLWYFSEHVEMWYLGLQKQPLNDYLHIWSTVTKPAWHFGFGIFYLFPPQNMSWDIFIGMTYRSHSQKIPNRSRCELEKLSLMSHGCHSPILPATVGQWFRDLTTLIGSDDYIYLIWWDSMSSKHTLLFGLPVTRF